MTFLCLTGGICECNSVHWVAQVSLDFRSLDPFSSGLFSWSLTWQSVHLDLTDHQWPWNQWGQSGCQLCSRASNQSVRCKRLTVLTEFQTIFYWSVCSTLNDSPTLTHTWTLTNTYWHTHHTHTLTHYSCCWEDLWPWLIGPSTVVEL